jgi:dTDP-4-dehydrorhamnose 3,5-epimerase
MTFLELDLPGVIEVVPTRQVDARGCFSEIFREDRFHERIGPVHFVQENQSLSIAAGTIRGLHFQSPPFAQGKLVRCPHGSVLDVAVDLRRGSPQFGRWTAVRLSGDAGNQLWIPAGFAHGFCTLEPGTIVAYKVTAYYSAANDRGLAWDDPDLAIDWPTVARAETLSAKDRAHPTLAALPGYFDYESLA